MKRAVSRVATKVFEEFIFEFEKDFLTLNLQKIIHRCINQFENMTDFMNKESQREAWKHYLNKFISAYI